MNDLIRVSNIGDALVVVPQEHIAARDALVDEGRELASCEDTFQASLIAAHVKKLKALKSSTEASRKSVKAPVLEIGREIDQLAKDFLADVEAEIRRLQAIANQFARKAEEERQRAIREARAKAEAEQRAAAEERRKAEEAKAREKAEEAEPAPFSELITQAAAAETHATNAAAARREAAQIEKAKATEQVPGMGTRTIVSFEVTDLLALLEYNRNLVEIKPKRAMILGLIKQGVDIPGIKATQTMEASIR
jgi:flagellar biosynthesis GTPase FlhF